MPKEQAQARPLPALKAEQGTPAPARTVLRLWSCVKQRGRQRLLHPRQGRRQLVVALLRPLRNLSQQRRCLHACARVGKATKLQTS